MILVELEFPGEPRTATDANVITPSLKMKGWALSSEVVASALLHLLDTSPEALSSPTYMSTRTDMIRNSGGLDHGNCRPGNSSGVGNVLSPLTAGGRVWPLYW